MAPFKKGPDYIDAAWLSAAAEAPGRNLDTFLMRDSVILESVLKAAAWADLAVIEGNRGLFDGMTATGDHATSELAKLVEAPVLLVVDCTKATRTVAAQIRGCQVTDPALSIGGVVLNRLATHRQEKVIREAVRIETGLEVLGAIPKLDAPLLPSRHLGLVTAMEHPECERALEEVSKLASKHLDLKAITALAERAVALKGGEVSARVSDVAQKTPPLRRVGIFKDKAFSFYYPENLEALEALGATLVHISPIHDESLGEVDALYAGGGFPEVYAKNLSENKQFRIELAKRIEQGVPVWAECGGLMYLSRSLTCDEEVYPMVGALPVDVTHTQKPKGHGYVNARVDRRYPFFEVGFEAKGHEFHYSRVASEQVETPTIFSLERGEGVGSGRDGFSSRNVVAAYTHLHALGTPEWAPAFMGAI